jgi:hypothetical protein
LIAASTPYLVEYRGSNTDDAWVTIMTLSPVSLTSCGAVNIGSEQPAFAWVASSNTKTIKKRDRAEGKLEIIDTMLI